MEPQINVSTSASDLPNVRRKAVILEERILELSGMRSGLDLHIFDVPVDMGTGRPEWVHTVRCGDQNSEVLLLLHGYGGTNAVYSNQLKDLSQRYKVFAIDLMGMGLSSRPAMKSTEPKDYLELFLRSLEEWRKFLQIERMVIAGHSFGGHIAGH